MRLAALVLLPIVLAAQQNPPLRIPDNVEVRRDVVYSSPGGRDLHMDLYLPKSAASARPAVLYIHGGGWQSGNKEAFSRQAALLAGNGYVGACIQYRLSGEATYPAAWDDSRAALVFLRKNAAQYGIDPSRIAAAGGSSGGHLVAMLGTNPRREERPRAVVAFNPAVDLVQFGKMAPGAPGNSAARFLGGSYAERPKVWEEATPTLHVDAACPPFLFLHGDADVTVPYSQSVEMMKRLQAAGVRAELFTAEGAQHGFFNQPPWFQPALDRTRKFLDDVLK